MFGNYLRNYWINTILPIVALKENKTLVNGHLSQIVLVQLRAEFSHLFHLMLDKQFSLGKQSGFRSALGRRSF